MPTLSVPGPYLWALGTCSASHPFPPSSTAQGGSSSTQARWTLLAQLPDLHNCRQGTRTQQVLSCLKVRGSGLGAHVSLDTVLRSHSHVQENCVKRKITKRKITKRLVVKSETTSSISHERILRLGASRHLVNLVLMVHYWIMVENALKAWGTLPETSCYSATRLCSCSS